MPADIFSRLEKRKAFPVDIDGQTVYVTEPTLGQIRRVQTISKEDSTGLALGLCLVNENGDRLIQQLEGESDEEFSRRVIDMASGLTVSCIEKLSTAILRLARPVDASPIAKN